ncbi:MAG: DUF4268 domain-containing protein [Bacteroidetes bacterium]|nr:DUF4268 domain-containing protein [Bacteroidota bacterium]
MLTKEESTEINRQFWGEFHKQMRGKKSANGRSISWLNYPTDVKNTYLRMKVGKNSAVLQYDVQFKDSEIRAIVWEQLNELKKIMEKTMMLKGEWIPEIMTPEGLIVSRISWELTGVNLYNKADHPKIYSFLEEHLLKFDVFYQEFKEIIIHLVR